MAEPTVSALHVIILNWNAAQETIDTVRGIAQWASIHPTVWVVDNASQETSVKAVARACPDVHLIRNTANLGFAGANNRAIERALADSDAPVLLLNNDAFVGERDVIQLLDALEKDPTIGVVGPLLYDADHPDHLISAGGRDISLHTHSHLLQVPGGDTVLDVDYVPGTVALLRSDLLRTVGLLDEDYFFAGEVADLCARGRQHGYRSVIDTRARARHTLSRSSTIRESLHIYYVFRNRFLFIRKFHPRWRLPLHAFWIAYGLGMSVKAQFSGKGAKAAAIRIGLRDGLAQQWGGQNDRVLRAHPHRPKSAQA